LGKRREVNRKIAEKAVVKERAERNRENNRNIAIGFVAFDTLAFLYLFVVTSTFAVKPNLTKLSLSSPSDIGSDHVNWMLNEVGAYKLHSFLIFGSRR